MRYMVSVQTEQNKVFKVRNQTTGFFQYCNDYHRVSCRSLHDGYAEKAENKRQKARIGKFNL